MASPDPAVGMPVFAAVSAAFTLMAEGPSPAVLDCSPYGADGLPAGLVPLGELRAWMLAHRGQGAYGVRNAIWRDLLLRARAEPVWMVAAIGMALPGLVRAAGQISRGHHGDTGDIDAEMLAAFIAAARAVDLAGERLYDKLRWHAVRAGLAARADTSICELTGNIEQAAGAAPRLPYGHPDLIVARAVAAGIITALDAELIMLTRLDRVPVEVAAARAGLEPAAARMRRVRAERALVTAIQRGDLSGGPDRHRPRAATGAVRSSRS